MADPGEQINTGENHLSQRFSTHSGGSPLGQIEQNQVCPKSYLSAAQKAPRASVERYRTHNLQTVKKIFDYFIYQDNLLGSGMYGKVYQSKLVSEARQENARTFACKVFTLNELPADELEYIEKEARLHAQITSNYCVRLHQMSRTESHIYLIQELCNGCDLAILRQIRHRMTQQEVSAILRQVVLGLKDLWTLRIIHRDIKPANILLHFPDHPELVNMNISQKKEFLLSVDLTKVNFLVKITDFGLSTKVETSSLHMSIVGTPLYSSPQLLEKCEYSYKVDIWALGVLCYELLMGLTPFHAQSMDALLTKVNDGRYQVATETPLTIECALFLTQCLQACEESRICGEELFEHPFVVQAAEDCLLTKFDYSSYQLEQYVCQKVGRERALNPIGGSSASQQSVVFSTQDSSESRTIRKQYSTLNSTKNTASSTFSHQASPQTKNSQLFAHFTENIDPNEGPTSPAQVVEEETKDGDRVALLDEIRTVQNQYTGSSRQRVSGCLIEIPKTKKSFTISQGRSLTNSFQSQPTERRKQRGIFKRFFQNIRGCCSSNEEAVRKDLEMEGIRQGSQLIQSKKSISSSMKAQPAEEQLKFKQMRNQQEMSRASQAD